MQLMLQAGAASGRYALKMFPEHFDSTPGSRWAERIPELKYVQLVRRDLLGHAISLSIARQTDSYVHWTPERRPAVYSRAHIQRCMAWLATGDARWSLFFARNGIVPLVVAYEDLCEDPQSVISAIGRHVGVPDARIGPLADEPRMQRNARSEEWRAQFIAESKDLGVLPSLEAVTYAEHFWRAEDARTDDQRWLRIPAIP